VDFGYGLLVGVGKDWKNMPRLGMLWATASTYATCLVNVTR
jgi:hypothetical protein